MSDLAKSDQSATLRIDDLDWRENACVSLENGATMRVDAALFDGDRVSAVVLTIPSYEMDAGFTQKLMAARLIPGLDCAIHVRGHVDMVLVARKRGEKITYRTESRQVAVGQHILRVSDILTRFPVTSKPGWSDLPLSGVALPHFDETESFLEWWDFYPGKQRFELIDGQVHLVPRLRPAAELSNMVFGLHGALAPTGLDAISYQLVKAGPLTVLCPSIVIYAGKGEDFRDTRAVILFRDPGMETYFETRASRFQQAGIDVTIFDTEACSFIDLHGAPVSLISLCSASIDLSNITKDPQVSV